MKIGYEAGRGKTFTPSMGAHWTDEFNVMLNSSSLSRNALTEKLIEDGLKYNKQEHILLETTGLSPGQAELLNSEAGQEILKNVLRLLLGESSNVVSSLASGLTSPIEQHRKEDSPIEPPIIETKKDSNKASVKPNTAMDKLKMRMQNLDQVKEDL